MNQVIICEAGFFWRRVMRRLEDRVNYWLKLGYRIGDMASHYGLVRVSFIVTLVK